MTQIEDSDPLKEEKRVVNFDPLLLSSQAIAISNLSKSYVIGEKAVDNLSFGLEFGECFALLGITGAGKTSTFKCLTGEESADIGDLYMGGFNVRTHSGHDKARCMIGYCPQFEAIFENLTVYHHLDFYAKIKGVRPDYLTELVDKTLKEMDLTSYAHVNAGTLSGGNKRKL